MAPSSHGRYRTTRYSPSSTRWSTSADGDFALASAGDRLVVVAAGYERHGVAAYEALTGALLWQRRDLKRGQQVSPAGAAVIVCFNQGTAHVLDARTGATVSTLRGVRAYWHSPHDHVGVASVTGHLSVLATETWRQIRRVPINGFAVLDAAFSPHAVLASDVVDVGPGGTVRSSVYSMDLSGQLLWHYPSPPSANCPALGWDATSEEWMGVETNVERLTEDTLVRWSLDGTVSSRVGLGRRLGTYQFLPHGRVLLADNGAIVETRRAR